MIIINTNIFESIIKGYKDEYHFYEPFPKADNREAWENLDNELILAIIGEADSYLHYDYPNVNASLFMGYYEEGDRSKYEKAYFSRRYALNALILGECVTYRGHYMKDIVNGIFAICEESGWQLPAHNTYERDVIGEPLPDFSRPILDLFACETGAVLSMAAYLLGDAFDKISPVIQRRIKYELQYRILTPYLNEHFWWMGRGDEPMNNWTIWCTQNVLLSLFFVDLGLNEKTKVSICEKAAKSTDFFLKEYGDDGCCDEGALYYRKAGLCLYNTIEILDGLTCGAFHKVYELQKIKNMATYIYNVYVGNGYYINFADCSAKPGPSGVREFGFGKRTGDIDLMIYAACDFVENNGLLLNYESNLFYHVEHCFLQEEVKAFAEDKKKVRPKDIYYKSVGLGIARDEHYCLAIKVGDNDDSHNHNDVGSFIIYKDESPLLIDIGVESYSKKTFSSQRYEIWTMQSDYHNLPTLNGYMQGAGEAYFGKVIKLSELPYSYEVICELSNAYPKEAEVSSYIRQIVFEKNEGITIKDHYELIKDTQSIPVISNLMTYEKPKVIEGKIHIGTIGCIELQGDIQDIQIETIQIRDERLKWSWEHEIYRIRITYTSRDLILKIQ